MRLRAVGPVGATVIVAALTGAGCSASNSADPGCTNESSAAPYSDAGILPLRALPTGFPCATSAVCAMTIDDCADDWPASAATPPSSNPNATPFVCECPDGVWTCTAQSASPPVCGTSAPPDADADANADADADAHADADADADAHADAGGD